MTIIQQYKSQIERLAEKFDAANLYDEIYQLVDKGKAGVIYSPRMGLVVAKPTFSNGEMGLLIWVAISNMGSAIKQYLTFFEDLTRRMGMCFIEFHSKRPGFKRVAKTFNFKQIHQYDGFLVYRKEVY